jgi:TorA maturation chaperone TorD
MEAEKLYPFYMLLCRYYEGRMCPMEYEDFRKLTASLMQEEAASEEGVAGALERLNGIDAAQFGKFRYAFNRLFVGPGRLLAPPYESSYLNEHGIVMQDETMAVRRAYLAQGLKLKKQNVEPDDHMALELQFVLELIERGENEVYHSFLEKHLLKWVKPHAERIENSTDDSVCLAMAQLMTAVFSIA